MHIYRYIYIYEKNANRMAYESFPHICPMWHNHMWGDPHSTYSLSPCDCATYANMRETLICHMTPIYLNMRKMQIIWHMRASLIFAQCVTITCKWTYIQLN